MPLSSLLSLAGAGVEHIVNYATQNSAAISVTGVTRKILEAGTPRNFRLFSRKQLLQHLAPVIVSLDFQLFLEPGDIFCGNPFLWRN
jgi:hypothetical protein